MHLEGRLWAFTKGVRHRLGGAVAIGLVTVGLGVLRLVLLGWLIGRIFDGDSIGSLAAPIIAIAAVMVVRGIFDYWRTMVAHRTAAIVQHQLRRSIFDWITELGPGTVARRRSGAVSLSLINGVEQLEVYFGQYLPQLLVSLLTPLLIFAVVAFIDLPVALIMLVFALIALFAPALWSRLETRKSLDMQQSYASFGAEYLDSIQGLATLKSFGQSEARANTLEHKAHDLFRKTMWVLATNVLSRGITDSAIACGAAAALALGAARVSSGAMELNALLIILMLGVEIFRPMRELRTVLHQGMVGMAAAQGIYELLDDEPDVVDADGVELDAPLASSFSFDDVQFSYPGTTRNVHDGLSFQVAPGERIGVVGASGCGKSSLVRLLLRFYDPTSGVVRLGGHDLRSLSNSQIRSMMSVVNQDTFLFHGTIEDNIAMGRPDATHDEIETAARTANIHDFVMGLDDGYATVVGEKGIKLSGGQRQRVALARAALRNAPILVLDEALSAVDAENEAVITQALDTIMQGRTTLVIAHRLSSVIDCDRILVLDQGRVVEQGTHDTLLAQGGHYSALMSAQALEASTTTPPARDLDDPTQMDEPSGSPVPASAAEQAEAAPAESVSTRDAWSPSDAPTEGILQAQGLSWRTLIVELLKMSMRYRGRLIATFVLGVARVLAFIAVGVFSALIVRALKDGDPYGGWLVALAIVAPLSGVLHWLESWVAHDMAFRLLAEMRISTFRKLDELAPAYLVRRRTGDLMALATNDIELVEYFFAHTIAPAFVAVLVPSVVLGVLATQSALLALVLVPFLLAVALSPVLMRRRVDELGSQAREAAGELGAFAVDSVQGIGEVVAFENQQHRGDGLDELSKRHIELRLPFFSQLTQQHSLLEVLTGLGGLAIVVVGGWLAQRGDLDNGYLPLLTLLAMSAFLPVSEIAQVGRQLADTLGATRRIYALENEPVVVTDGPGVDLANDQQAAPLALADVDFAYPGHERKALEQVTIDIAPGSVVALVGTSGAGKTTAALLMMRFWDPEGGSVSMDFADLRDHRLDSLRNRIALVAQDTYLFNDTLRANILIGRPEATEQQLLEAVELAALGDVIETLPNGLDTMVGERGTSLSGGQRQRVAIARAFLKDAPVLVLDEATSHLDAVNEDILRSSLEQLQADRTTVVIAHRLSTIRRADLIVVLDNGRVVEQGTHESLLEANGLYRNLVSHQLASAGA